MVEDKNYFEGQDSDYESVGLDPEVISNNDTFTEDIEPNSSGLNFAADNAQDAIDSANADGVSWAADQEVKVVQAIDAYNEANDANLNISKGEIQKIINAGGDYETSITQYYDTFKQTQTNLIQTQKNYLTSKFNNFKTKFTDLKSANQDVLNEMDILDTMKTDGSTVADIRKKQRQILGMIDDLDNIRSENTAAYSAYFHQKNTYDAVVRDSNQAIKTINSKYKAPPVPSDVQEFDQFISDSNDVSSEILDNITKYQNIVNGVLSDAEAAEEIQNIRNATNETILADADANITQIEAQFTNVERALTDARTALNKAFQTATTSTNAITKEESGGIFISAGQNDIKSLEAAKANYVDIYAKWSAKRNVLIEAIQDRNSSDAYTQLFDAGESPTEMLYPASTSESNLSQFLFSKRSFTTKIGNLVKKFRTNVIKFKTLNLTVTDYSAIDSEISENKRLLKNAEKRLETANRNFTNAVNNSRREQALARAKKEQDIINEIKQNLLNSENQKATMLATDKQAIQGIQTSTDDIIKNKFNLPVDDTTNPAVYETQMESLNAQMGEMAEDITETMNIDPEIDITSLEIEGLMSGTNKAFGTGSMTARLTSNLTRAARTLRSTKTLYTDLFSRFNLISRDTTLEELAAGIDDLSLGSRIMSGTSMVIGATSSFISRALMAPVLYSATALAGPYIGSMIAATIGRSIGPIGIVLALAGTGFQIWADQSAVPPPTFMIKATNSTRDNLVMPLPAGAPESLRDTGHDQYGNFQTTSYLNYMKYYLNDTDKFQTAINGGYSAMEAYRSIFTGFPLVYHANRSLEGRGGVGQESESYYSVDYTNQTEGQAYSYFQLMYNNIKHKYDTFVASGLSDTKAMNLTITDFQGQVSYAQDNNRPLYLSRYTNNNGAYEYGSINGFSEKDTAKALAEFKENPYVFAGLPESTLVLMGLPTNINDPDFVDSDTFETLTDNNSFYTQEYAQVQQEVATATANAQVASYKKLISTIPDDQTKVKQYFLYQLDQLQQDPAIASDLTGLNKMRAPFVPPLNLVQQDYLDILTNPYYFSINAAWNAQTDHFTNIDDFNDDNINSLPSWFSLDPTDDNNFEISTIENAKLAEEATLQEQLGLYDYNLSTLGADGGKVFQDSYTYHTDTLTNIGYDLQKLKGGSDWYLWLLNSPDQKNLLRLYQSYYKQYQLEGVDDASDSAYQTIVNQLQLAVDNGDDYRIYTEHAPDGTLVTAASAMGALNSSQLAYYQALYNQDHTRYMGYNDAALLALGLNTHLANGELFPGETVGRNNESIDPDLLAHFTSMVSDRDINLRQLEIQGVVYGEAVPLYEADGKFSGTYINPSDPNYDSEFQTEFPNYDYSATGYDPYATTTQTQTTQDVNQASGTTDNTDNNQE